MRGEHSRKKGRRRRKQSAALSASRRRPRTAAHTISFVSPKPDYPSKMLPVPRLDRTRANTTLSSAQRAIQPATPRRPTMPSPPIETGQFSTAEPVTPSSPRLAPPVTKENDQPTHAFLIRSASISLHIPPPGFPAAGFRAIPPLRPSARSLYANFSAQSFLSFRCSLVSFSIFLEQREVVGCR